MYKKISLILVVIWMAIIFIFSNQNANKSLNLSNKVIEHSIVEEETTEEVKQTTIKEYTFPIRKLAHYTLYFILGILVINLILQYNIKYKVSLSILICIIYSITDEIHQLFIPCRTGRILDVFIDSTGSITSIIIFYLIYKLINKNKKEMI